VASFWAVIEFLYQQDFIRDGRDCCEDGYLGLCRYPVYQKEVIQRRDSNYLTRSTLEYYLELDKTMFASKVMKRFGWQSKRCYKMKYAKQVLTCFLRPVSEKFSTDEDYKKSVLGIKKAIYEY